MLKMLSKAYKILFIFLYIFVNISPITVFESISYFSKNRKENIVDKIYNAKNNINVVDNFSKVVTKVDAAVDSAELEYTLDIGPINGSTSANYVYATAFNPSSSGRTAVIKRIMVKSNAVTTGNWINLSVRRITAASGGTQITAANIPKKNSNSSNSIMEIRHTIGTTGVTLSGSTNSRIINTAAAGVAGAYYSQKEYDFYDSDEGIVLKEGEGIALYQEAAGDVDQRNKLYIDWQEVASAPTAQNEFIFTFPRVEVAATSGYIYQSFFNPSASGKTAVIKRLAFGTETCDTNAVYTNDISLIRTSAASGGTQVTSSDVPKKHTSTSNSVMEYRTTGVTVTQVGGNDARFGVVTPCAASSQPSGYISMKFSSTDEYLILQPGEGIAVKSEAAGDVDQLVKLELEWEEMITGPSSAGEYLFAYPRISGIAAIANTTFYTFFNPSGSGKTAVVKRILINVNAAAGATYAEFTARRITAASAGTLVTASDVPKKHTSTSNTVMQLRHCGTACATAITTTYAGTTDSRLLSVNGAGTIAQLIGKNELHFKENEKLVIKEGEGFGFYIAATGDIDHYVKFTVEWDEEASAPTSQGQYVVNMGPVSGSITSGYTFVTMMNPSASGKVAIIKKISIRVDAAAAAVAIPMTLRRLSAASGGTLLAAADIPKKNTSASNTVMEMRRTGVTTTYSGSADSRIISVQTPSAVASVAAPSISGYYDVMFTNDDPFLLRAGEGIGFYQEGVGDTDLRAKVLIEWDEEISAPTVDGEYIMSTGPITGNATSGYVYTTFFNPSSSGKITVIKRIGMQVNRTIGTPVAPTYEVYSIRGISASSSGTQVTSSNIPKKDSTLGTSTIEVRTTNPTVTYTGVADSRRFATVAPGAVNQDGTTHFDQQDSEEIILNPGEGFAIYQESAPGDTFRVARMSFVWYEINVPAVVSISVSDGNIAYGSLSWGQTRSTTDLTDTQVVTNDGNVTETVNIKGNNSTTCTWTLGASAGIETYRMEASINAGAYSNLTTSYQTFITGLLSTGTKNLDLRITSPTSTSCTSQDSLTINLQAVQE